MERAELKLTLFFPSTACQPVQSEDFQMHRLLCLEIKVVQLKDDLKWFFTHFPLCRGF